MLDQLIQIISDNVDLGQVGDAVMDGAIAILTALGITTAVGFTFLAGKALYDDIKSNCPRVSKWLDELISKKKPWKIILKLVGFAANILQVIIFGQKGPQTRTFDESEITLIGEEAKKVKDSIRQLGSEILLNNTN